MITELSSDRHTLTRYLSERDIPIDEVSLARLGLELAGPGRITEVLGFTPGASPIGIIIHYPGTDYSTVRLVPGGPRCPKGQPPHAYLPQQIAWGSVSGALYLCESPIKALTLARYGYNAMSAAGTTTLWMSGKQQWCVGFPHSALDTGAITEIIIAFDSDSSGGINHNVERDVRTLARSLAERHPNVPVQHKMLSPPPDELLEASWGIDDFHAFYGEDALRAWVDDRRNLVVPEADAQQNEFDELNAAYAACLNPVGVVALASGVLYKTTDFTSTVEAPRVITRDDKRVSIAPLWVAWQERTEVKEIRYAPGGPAMVLGDYYNLWRDDGVQPVQGDVTPWLRLINSAIKDTQTSTLMLQCMAYQVQHRGSKLPKLLYFTGRHMGTGKSTLAMIMAKILGETNSVVLTKQEFEGQFNSVWSRRELAVLDDCEPLSKGSWSKMKATISGTRITVTEKFKPSMAQDYYTVLYVTANANDVIKFDADERRILMIHFDPATLHRSDSDTYWRDFYAWLDNGGYSHIAHYLATYDLGTFNPDFYPPFSAVKAAALDATRAEEEVIVEDIAENTFSYLPQGRKFVTSRELFMISTGEAPTALNKEEMRQFVTLINRQELFSNACPQIPRPRIGGHRCQVYRLPGVPETATIAVIKRNIEQYPIEL